MNLKKMVGMSVLALVLAPVAALAGGLEDAQARLTSPRAFWYEVHANSSSVMNVYYVGSGTQAVLSVDANSLDAQVPYGTADTNFGTSGGSYDITAAAYDTLGELCDAIEALADYGCELTGGKRDDSSLILRDRAAVIGDNLKGPGGFDIKTDTGPVVVGAGDSSLSNIMTMGFWPAPGKRIVLKKCDVNGNVAGDYRVFGKSAYWEVNSRANSRKNASVGDTTNVWLEATADDTTETYDWTPASAVSASDGWQFATNEHVVVRFGEGSAGTAVQAPANYLRCLVEER